MIQSSRPTAIDLFCGAGGMTLGFEQAGFNVVAAFDVEDFNVQTHALNFPDVTSVATDLSKATGTDLLNRAGLQPGGLDVLFGGPPCQGFSVGGRQNLGDKRNLLVYDFARLVREIRPSYFVMENVQGFLSPHAAPLVASFLRRVKRAGYAVVEPIRVLNAAEYGVPQRRQRAFILGYLKHLSAPEYPRPCGCIDSNGDAFDPVVKDAIADLPNVDSRDELFNNDEYIEPLAHTENAYALLMRGEIRSKGDFSTPRPSSASRSLSGCLRTRHSETTINRFKTTTPGKPEPISRYFRLAWDSVAPTIRAGTGTDHGSHTAPRPIHPSMPRCITSREAARLHSFPDWFQFHGTRWHDFRQIGNSVPPHLARAVAERIAKILPSES